MRIAMVGTFGFHPNKTMRARAFRLARELVKIGHQVKLFMPPWHTPEEADKSWVESGVAIRNVPLTGGIAGITRHLFQEVLAWQPDIVHCFKPKAYSGLVAWWLWHLYRHQLKVVIDTDDWEGAGGWNDKAPYPWYQKRFFAWQEKWGMNHCHLLTVASRTLQSLAWGHGVLPKKVLYLPNGAGIDVPASLDILSRRNELGLQDRPTLLLYSRLFEFDTKRLVDILQKVVLQVPTLAILSVGASLYDRDAVTLRRHLEDANLIKHIVEVGWLDEDELPQTLSGADAGIYLMEDTLLNRTKCPVKLVDMVTCGVPIVAEKVGQVSEYIVHGETGFLHRNGNHAGIIADLVKLFQNRELCRQLSTQARLHIQQLTWEKIIVNLDREYKRLLFNKAIG